MTEAAKTPEWVGQKKKEYDQAEQLEFLRVTEGEHTVEIDLRFPPQERDGKFGIQYVYVVTLDGNRGKISVTERLDRAIINALSEQKNPMTIIKAGTGLQTRYSVK